jgi:hypothetical protein
MPESCKPQEPFMCTCCVRFSGGRMDSRRHGRRFGIFSSIVDFWRMGVRLRGGVRKAGFPMTAPSETAVTLSLPACLAWFVSQSFPPNCVSTSNLNIPRVPLSLRASPRATQERRATQDRGKGTKERGEQQCGSQFKHTHTLKSGTLKHNETPRPPPTPPLMPSLEARTDLWPRLVFTLLSVRSCPGVAIDVMRRL